MRFAALLLLIPSLAFAQPGYPPKAVHFGLKLATPAVTYLTLKELGVPKALNVPLSALSTWGIGKALEIQKGHQISTKDAIHDLGWHLLGALLASKSWTLSVLASGTILLTRSWSVPGW